MGVYFWFTYHRTFLNPLAVMQQKRVHIRNGLIENSIVEALHEAHIQYTNFLLHRDNTATILLPNKATVIISTRKNIGQQITSLQLTIATLTIEGKQFQKLDFRFDKPVIVF